MNAVVIEHVKISDLPEAWRAKLAAVGDARVTVRIDEVDKSLNAWGWALHEYLQHEQRWGQFAPWRWYMRRWWLPMTPRSRRITYMLVMVTVAEMLLILLGAAIYWIEFAG